MSIVDTFHKTQSPVEPKFTAEWWRSDAAIAHRAAGYLAGWLKELHGSSMTPDGSLPPEPNYPAIWIYDCLMDSRVWIRCDRALWLRDFTRAYPDQINKAARDLLNNTENPHVS